MGNQNKDNRSTKRLIGKIKPLLAIIFVIFVLFYLLPAVVLMVINFFNDVVFGDYNVSEFSWQGYSYRQVNGFYLKIFDSFKDLIYRLTH